MVRHFEQHFELDFSDFEVWVDGDEDQQQPPLSAASIVEDTLPRLHPVLISMFNAIDKMSQGAVEYVSGQMCETLGNAVNILQACIWALLRTFQRQVLDDLVVDRAPASETPPPLSGEVSGAPHPAVGIPTATTSLQHASDLVQLITRSEDNFARVLSENENAVSRMAEILSLADKVWIMCGLCFTDHSS